MATWVVGDIHGCYDDFMNILHNENIKENDTIILIGDIIDRGPDSYKMIMWAMENVSPDGKYQMVLGNHEDYVIQDLRACRNYYAGRQKEKEKYLKMYPDDAEYIRKEYVDWDKLSVRELQCDYDFDITMDSMGYITVESVVPIIEWFESLPLCKKVTVTMKNGKKQKYVIAHAWYDKMETRGTLLLERDIDWTGDLEKDYEPSEGEILIHGHTPTCAINECKEKPVNEVLFRKNSINIDCGCVFSEIGGNLAAIRLEDQKVIYLKTQEKVIYPERRCRSGAS